MKSTGFHHAVPQLPKSGIASYSAATVDARTPDADAPEGLADLVEVAHANGIVVHVWTIDDPDEMRSLLDAGVDGIMTDRPAELREVFEERGIWHQ